MKKKTLTPENEKKLESFLKSNMPEPTEAKLGEKDRILRAALQDETSERFWPMSAKWFLPSTAAVAAALTLVLLINPFKTAGPSAQDLAIGEFLLSSASTVYSDEYVETDSPWSLLIEDVDINN